MNNVRKLWEKCNIAGELPALADRVRFDEPMSGHTTFKVGGPADVYVDVESAEELSAVLFLCQSQNIPVWILGGGSNLVVSDNGLRGVCVSLSAMRSLSVSDDATLVTAGAGCAVSDLVSWCAERNLSGLEEFAGLPGTVGGAVYMNARCYGRSVSDVFFRAEVLYLHGERYTIEVRDMRGDEWDYKKSPFQSDAADSTGFTVVLSASFRVSPGEPEKIREVMDRCIADRDSKGHFRFPSAGSMFKNNRAFGKSSGQIIDEAGLCGFTVGGAQVAPWHGNLVINRGGASAADIRELVERVRSSVQEKTGFLLETEVVFAGEW